MPAAGLATKDYQRHQVALRALNYADVTLLWNRLLDPERLDDSFPMFAAATIELIKLRRAVSADLARKYIAARRAGVPGVPPAIPTPRLNEAAAVKSLGVTAVAGIKSATARRVPLPMASRNALVRTMGVVDKYVGDGGRELIRASIAADPMAQGWVRRTLGTCSFCEEEAREEHVERATADFPRHDHCGCQPEPQYAAPDLMPEEEFVQKIQDMLKADSTTATEDQLRAMLSDPNTKPLTKVNIQTALDREAAKQVTAAKEAAAEVAQSAAETSAAAEPAAAAPERLGPALADGPTSNASGFTPEELRNALDPTRKRSASAIIKELESTPAGRDLAAEIKRFTETRGGVANLRKSIEKTLDGTASDSVRARAQAFLDAVNTYPREDVPKLFRGFAVKVEENTDAWWDAFEGQFQPGQKFSMNASSFSSSEKKAAEFSRMIGGTRKAGSNYTAVRMELEGGQALPVETLSKFRSEREWITGGDFEVVGYQRATPSQPYYKVIVRQTKRLGAP